MFVINLTYIVELDQVEPHLEAHISYLKQQYQQGHFIASGRKVPRTGGLILSNLTDRAQLDNILSQDPFHIHQLAQYDIIEFIPSMTSPELAFLQNQ
ncbi:MAG: YciI family protein [Bacteroidota bacterium]